MPSPKLGRQGPSTANRSRQSRQSVRWRVLDAVSSTWKMLVKHGKGLKCDGKDMPGFKFRSHDKPLGKF